LLDHALCLNNCHANRNSQNSKSEQAGQEQTNHPISSEKNDLIRKAIDHFQRIPSTSSFYSQGQIGHALSHEMREDFDEAIALLNQVIDNTNDHMKVKFDAANILARLYQNYLLVKHISESKKMI